MSHVTNVSQHIVVPTIFGWSPDTQNPFLGRFTLTRKAFVSRYKVVHEYVHYSHVVRGSMSHVRNVSKHIVVPTIFGWSPVTQNPFLGGFTLTTTKNSSTHKTLEQLHLRADLSSSRREFDSSDDTTYVAGEFTMNANCLFSSKRFRDNENISIL